MLLLVIHCVERDDKKIMGQQDCTYTKYLTQMMCERSEEEERKREREDGRRPCQMHSCFPLLFSWPFRKERTENTLPPR